MSRLYSEAEDHFLLTAYARGAGLSAIAETLKRSPRSVTFRHALLLRKARIRERRAAA